MAKDYAHPKKNKIAKRGRSRTKTQHKTTSWITGILIITLVTLVAWLWIHSKFSISFPSLPIQHLLPKASPKIQIAPPLPATSQPEPIHFDFYTMLPKKSAETAWPSHAALNRPHYVVQIASTANPDHAEHLKQELNQLGFKVNIVPISRGNTTWYRVQMGPFLDKTAATFMQNQLEEHQTPSLVIEIK